MGTIWGGSKAHRWVQVIRVQPVGRAEAHPEGPRRGGIYHLATIIPTRADVADSAIVRMVVLADVGAPDNEEGEPSVIVELFVSIGCAVHVDCLEQRRAAHDVMVLAIKTAVD
eukprot:4200440-Prymnesium_polylepis.1